MIHYHGTPCGGTRQDVARFLMGRHALVPFPRQDDMGIVAEVCQSFVFDNGAFSVANVLPGEYLVAAIAPDRHVDLEDPSVYAALARSAARVTVEPGAQATVSLSLGGATR